MEGSTVPQQPIEIGPATDNFEDFAAVVGPKKGINEWRRMANRL